MIHCCVERCHLVHGKPNHCKWLVFDNPNSSTARYMKELAGIEELPKEVYSFKVNKDVVKFISEMMV
jgi:phosphate transport system substrate-binding protein